MIQLSRSAFNATTCKLAFANGNQDRNKLLESDSDFIYDKSKGEFIFNANGPLPGFGFNGGVFATIIGAPQLASTSISFI